jgi:hypothetical protein
MVLPQGHEDLLSASIEFLFQQAQGFGSLVANVYKQENLVVPRMIFATFIFFILLSYYPADFLVFR